MISMEEAKPINQEALSYRQNAVGVILNSEGEIILVQKKNYGGNQWDFPGGGIESGEKVEEALLRELREELSSTQFEVVKKSERLDRYEWPESVILRELKERRPDLERPGTEPVPG